MRNASPICSQVATPSYWVTQVHGIDVIHTFDAVLIALVGAIDA